MSRGLGTWQRAILDRLDREPWCFLWEVLPPDFTQDQRFACRRAVTRLRQQGLVEVRWVNPGSWRPLVSTEPGGAHTLVLRLGTTLDDEEVRGRFEARPRRTWVHAG
jgi:hypothetical protein